MKYLLPNKHPSPADSLLTKGTILQSAEDAQFPLNSLKDEGAYALQKMFKAGIQSSASFRIWSKAHFNPELRSSDFFFLFLTSESNKWIESYFSPEYFLCFWKILLADWLLWNIYLIYLFFKFLLHVHLLFSRYTDKENIYIPFFFFWNIPLSQI